MSVFGQNLNQKYIGKLKKEVQTKSYSFHRNKKKNKTQMAEQKLTPQHMKELTSFLAFFNSKKTESFKEIDLDFKDFLYDNLQETIFNKEDVEKILQDWNSSVKKTLSNDFSNINRMAAIYVQYLFQQTGVEFSLNLNLLEDMKMLETMKKVESGEVQVNSLENPSKSNFRTQGSKLPSLMESQKTDLNLQKINELESQLNELRQQNKKLKEELVKVAQNKSGQTVEDFSSGNEEEMKNEILQLQTQMKELKVQNDLLQEDAKKKLNESAQFNNLKKMIQQKNEQLKEVKDKQTFRPILNQVNMRKQIDLSDYLDQVENIKKTPSIERTLLILLILIFILIIFPFCDMMLLA